MKNARPEGQALPPDILTRLKAAVVARQGHKEGAEIRFLCPVHDDNDPSAKYNTAKYVWWCPVCSAGGGALDLARRLDLDLPEREPEGLTVAGLAYAKGLDENFLRSLGVRDGRHFDQVCIVVPYCDESGEVRAERRRLRLTGGARFKWRKGDKTLPYGLPRLPDACSAGQVVLVEGESDAWTLWQAGIPALGIPGAGTWRTKWAAYLDGIETVYAWREPDAGGDTLAAKVIRDLPEVRLIEAPPDAKDPNELSLLVGRDPEAFRQRMDELMASARPASELRAEALTAEAREAFAKARHLLEAPDLLGRIADAIRAGGYAGDTTPAMLAYAAITSRLLERPINLSYVAQSAAGKNKAIDVARDLMPKSAYILITAASPRALIYSEDDYQHRTVIFAEADSIPADGPAASAIRSLITDNEMAYEVVEKHPETGQFTVRRIVKPGPTGLITTSTKPLPWQMNTRVLVVPVSDTPQQTRAVMAAHVAAVNGDAPSADVESFLALQRWLQLAGHHRVTVPYARALSEAVPADQVRMRRDFRLLLTTIQVVALLYQRQRQRDAQGRIIATLDDYGMARRLVLDVFTAAATGGVTPAIRETAEAVAALHDGENGVTVKAVGDRMGLAPNTAWYRVQAACRLRYLVNLETRPRQPAQLVPGDPLPEGPSALPEPEDLACDGAEGDGCADHPQDNRDAETALPSLICAEPSGANQGAFQTPAETAVETSTEPASNTESTGLRAAFQRFNRDRDAVHTHAPGICADCGSPGAYTDPANGEWWCQNHGPTWTTVRRGGA